MKKTIIFGLLVCLMLLSACGDGGKLQAAYDAIGTIGFSDESVLTVEETARLQEMRNQKEAALGNKSIDELERLNAEWKAFAKPINDFINK